MKGVNAAEQSVRGAREEMRPTSGVVAGQRPAALVGNEVISWSELTPLLAEAAGAVVLEEACLDRVLAQEAPLRGVVVGAEAVEREKELLAATLALTAGVAKERQGELIEQLRRTRGLGEKRYGALLRRSATLREMVHQDAVLAPSVAVEPEDVKQAFEIRYGQKFQTRLILVRTEKEAAEVLARLHGKDGKAPESFTDVAVSMSIDASRMRGGLIGAISPADPSYPLLLRKAIVATAPGTVSPVIALEQGYALVLMEQIVPASETNFDNVAGELEREVRLVRERAAMDRLAAQLLRGANVTVLDPSLEWSWKARQ